MTCSMLLSGRYMLVFHSRNDEDKVHIELQDMNGKTLAETYEHFSEVRSLCALVTE